MKFQVPSTSKKRLSELLTYLDSREKDFNKCFDVNSRWCWRYADLMLRGLKKRKLTYAERHHIVPASLYGTRGVKLSDEGNLTVLRYSEHLYAHYCAVKCARGKFQGILARAFYFMYNIGVNEKRPLLPSERELIDSLPRRDIEKNRNLDPQVNAVESEGRVHYWEGKSAAQKSYYQANKKKICKRARAYGKANSEKVAKQHHTYYLTHKDELSEKRKKCCTENKTKLSKHRKKYYAENRDAILERSRTWYAENKERVAKRNKEYYRQNKDKINARRKAYQEATKDKKAAYDKIYREKNKETIAVKQKAYRETHKEKLAKRGKAWREKNKDKIRTYRKEHKEKLSMQNREYKRALYKKKVSAGYRLRKNPNTGKQEWIYVGMIESAAA